MTATPLNTRCTCDTVTGDVHFSPACPFYVEWRDRRPAACYRLECGHRRHDGRPNPFASPIR
jgi:hypothetical protein